MSFETIETQEQFDELVKERIARAKESARKEVEAELSELATLKKEREADKKTGAEQTELIEALRKELEAEKQNTTDLHGTVARLEAEQRKMKIAREVGLPYEMACRLTGDTEDELRKDAEGLKGLFGQKTAPRVGYEKEPADDRKSMIASMLASMDTE